MFVEFTFKDRRTIGHVWSVDGLRFRHGQSCESEFVIIRRQASRCQIHRFELVLRDDIHAEGALVEDIAE